jgi:2-dehydropantoate 2-reductase
MQKPVASTTPWHVLGAGSIGCLFAERLMAAGCAVTLLLRNPDRREQLLTNHGIRVQRDTESSDHLPQVEMVYDQGSAINKLLVATKAHQAVSAVKQVAERFTPDSTIVLLHNGMGVNEELSNFLPHLCIANAVTTEGSYTTSPFNVCHSGQGTTWVGRFDGGPKLTLVGDLEAAGFDVYWDDDIESRLLQKLATNCAINPLTARHRCLNGELLDSGSREQELDALCKEISSAFQAMGHSELATKLGDRVRQVINSTATNRSSMLQDVDRGAPTEIDITCPLNDRELKYIRQLADPTKGC